MKAPDPVAASHHHTHSEGNSQVAPQAHRKLALALSLSSLAAIVAWPLVLTETITPAPKPPAIHTPWGHPDLQGFWTNATATPLERITAAERGHAAGVAAVTTDPLDPGAAGWELPAPLLRAPSLVIDPPDGRIPMTAAAVERLRRRERDRHERGEADSWLDRNPWERCIGLPLPVRMLPTSSPNTYLVLQTPDTIAIHAEMIHETRIVPLRNEGATSPPQRVAPRSPAGTQEAPGNERATSPPQRVAPRSPAEAQGAPGNERATSPPQRVAPRSPAEAQGAPGNERATSPPQWSGHSRGWFEGGTLVIETDRFGDNLDGGPVLPATPVEMAHRAAGSTLRLVERFEPRNRDRIDYRMTIEDSAVAPAPYTIAATWRRLSGGQVLWEYACHEGNHGMANILRGARADEGRALDAARRAARARSDAGHPGVSGPAAPFHRPATSRNQAEPRATSR